jgi:hypothetical protein
VKREPDFSRRRLTWPQQGGSQDSADDGCGHEEHGEPGGCSPCHAAAADGSLLGPITFSTPVVHAQASADADRAFVKSPIIDGALFLENRRKARILAQGSRLAAAEGSQLQQIVGEEQAAAPAETALQHVASSVQLQPRDVLQDAAVEQCQRALAAAGSSSRGCLDLLCWGIGLDQQVQQAAASPATPAAACAGLLPAPPRKRSAVRHALPAGGLTQPCRTIRSLPGLAPSNETELQAMRVWMSVQRVS